MPIPKLVVTAALMAAQVALGMTQKTKGPRLDSLKTTTADYGTPIPRFWGKRKFECPVIWAEDLRETKKTSKGKSGKNTQYKYFATFGVLICDHEIDAVTRIWMDDKLVYQTTDAGPVSIGAAAGLTVGGNMRIYLGTEDQVADPRMEAWCDDRYGANSCPAYRGSAYIVFEELPVNNFGNRIPNITVEAVNNKTNIYPYEIKSNAASGLDGGGFSPSGTIFVQTDSPDITIWDVPTRTIITQRTLPFSVGSDLGITDSEIYVRSGALPAVDSYLYVLSLDGTGGAELVHGFDAAFGACRYVGGSLYFYPVTSNEANIGVYGGGSVTELVLGFATSHFIQDLDGGAWAIGSSSVSGNNLYIASIPTDSPNATITTSAGAGVAYGMVNRDGNFVIYQNAKLYLIDGSTFAIISSATIGGSNNYAKLAMDNVQPGAPSVWIGFSEYDTSDLSLIRTVDASDWVSQPLLTGAVYDRVNNAILSHETATDELTWRYLDRVGSNGVTLKTVVDSVSDWCGLTGQDTTALTQTVLGYSVTQGSGKDMIAPLLDIHDVDCRPHDFQVQFVNRGGSPSGTFLTEDFVRNGDRYKVTIKQDTDLPKEVTINFADWDHDQNPNNVISARPALASSSSRSETIDLSTYADTADGAQRKADRFIRRAWNSRESANLSLTAQCLALEPADVTTVSLDGALRNVRLNKMTIAGQQIDCEFIRDETAFAVLNNASGPAFQGSDTDTITVPGPARGFILDAPLIRDADNDVNPILYYAAGGILPDWVGASVNRGDDGTYDETIASIDSSQNATWGYATSELGTANPNLWDGGNTVDVTVYGTLTTHTEAELNADAELNLIALGDTGRWEYLQFATATLTGTSGPANTYTLSGFRRGRRGTEINVGTHTDGDNLLLLNRAYPTELGAGDIGATLSFKIQSFGRDPEAAPAIDIAPYTGAALKPYAPARIIWTTDGTDMFGEIIRRTRVGGTFNGSAISLGETSEAYEVDIYQSTTFKRTITVSGGNTFTYTGSQIAADGNAVGFAPPCNVYQMSSTVGRGFALAA